MAREEQVRAVGEGEEAGGPGWQAEDEAAGRAGEPEAAAPAGEEPAADGGGPAPAEAEARRIAELEAELERRGRLCDEYLASLQRLKADFDNYRRRMMQEQARWQELAVGEFVAGLLPVVDNLERALSASGDAEAIRQGVELTLRQFRDVLRQAGVEPMEAAGRPFDPAFHEAMAQVETDEHPDGHVIDELRKGYLFRKQVLRPALVRVARSPAAEEAKGT
jgi:molecular chaperone GrpE